jgi:hypothetical protein
MVCILLCMYLYNIYLLISLHNNFYNDKINTTVATFVFYVRVVLYGYMFRSFYWVIFRSVRYTLQALNCQILNSRL